ncbi:MAG TPA: FumA C-terminus/TtdB family hydratase beta subunit [Candidatus Avimonas sp.]|nr:TRZ/ATZ family protein [Clostridiales bacterium]HOB35851.1 FumA C-terminus/TtdB family hydratase beta subunit [Candidatus Avimonas sp.]HQA15417.1 FumA C-terminus/TtdB family hydratase beta subunit [Candidatus Avimonas sp.]HQD37377.1 FumA C-terminus/TtdB family hydratase beta subunit [Candidatus Avimonas sp.]
MVTGTVHLSTDNLRQYLPSLNAGDRILLSGTVYTSRDAAHKRIFELLEKGAELPYSLMDAVIYYTGATPAPKGLPIGSCGPTTSSRMDLYAPRLYGLGVAATIGKGNRSAEVEEAIKRNRAVYFCAVGGAGALAAQSVLSSEVVAFEDLGCEAVHKLRLDRFPLIVGIDSRGRNLFKLRG